MFNTAVHHKLAPHQMNEKETNVLQNDQRTKREKQTNN